MGHFRITLWLNSFSLSVSEKRLNKQYSKEYKAKEVSEGEESKDFWNVLGGKANFTSLSGGLYWWTIGCTLIILNKFYARVIQRLHESENSQKNSLIVKPRGRKQQKWINMVIQFSLFVSSLPSGSLIYRRRFIEFWVRENWNHNTNDFGGLKNNSYFR